MNCTCGGRDRQRFSFFFFFFEEDRLRLSKNGKFVCFCNCNFVFWGGLITMVITRSLKTSQREREFLKGKQMNCMCVFVYE